MRIIASALCKQGGREYNQDAYAVNLSDKHACIVVCDGLGSYVGSEIASTVAANTICDKFSKHIKDGKAIEKKSLQNIFEYAHDLIQDAKERDYQISSSCTTAAFFGSNLTDSCIAHIGDSRVYFIRDKKIVCITKDHSMAQFAVDLGKITRDQIRNHPDQNKLTRVLGSDYYSNPDINLDVPTLQEGDVIILCSDGFWEYVYEDDMITLCSESLTPDNALDKMEKKLLKRAPKHNDNYTAVVAFVVSNKEFTQTQALEKTK